MFLVSGLSQIFRRTSSPDMSGRCMSRNTRSTPRRLKHAQPVAAKRRVQQLESRPLLHDALHEPHIRHVVFDVENRSLRRTVAARTSRHPPTRRVPGRTRLVSSHPERAALIDDAVDADLSAHHLRERRREHQAQAGAFHRRMLRAETLERLEQQLDLRRRDARAGVRDHDAAAIGVGRCVAIVIVP